MEKNQTVQKVKNIFMSENPYLDLVLAQEKFYRDVFKMECDFSSVIIPERPGDDWRLRIIIDLKLEQFYAKCQELFPCWRLTDKDLDEIVTRNERDAKNGPYAIWVRNRVEADEELKNLPATKIKEMNIKTETLAERLIDELEFFTETGGHLDIQNITLCAGSRRSGGYVPRVFWVVGELGVSYCGPGLAGGDLRSRQAVS